MSELLPVIAGAGEEDGLNEGEAAGAGTVAGVGLGFWRGLVSWANASTTVPCHPLIDKNRSNFLRDIKVAEQAIRREPPNFLLASSVTGACIYCHGGRAVNE